jgi:hypothetical protein
VITKKITDCLRDSDFITISFGSKAKEEDVLVFSPSAAFTPIGYTVLDFISLTENLNILGNSILITKHEHRAFAPQEARLCHLLFYPTIKHLTLLELPSFISSVLSTGIINDTNMELETIARNYLTSIPNPLMFDTVFYHLARYDDIVLSSLFYALTDKQVIPLRALAYNLAYAFRFMVSECILRLSPEPHVQKTSWAEVIDILSRSHNVSKHTVDFLLAIKRESPRFTKEEIISVSYEYLTSRDKWIFDML